MAGSPPTISSGSPSGSDSGHNAQVASALDLSALAASLASSNYQKPSVEEVEDELPEMVPPNPDAVQLRLPVPIRILRIVMPKVDNKEMRMKDIPDLERNDIGEPEDANLSLENVESRKELQPIEMWEEPPRVRAMLKGMDKWAAEMKLESERVHKEYRGSDRPKGWQRKEGSLKHTQGSLRTPTAWTPCAVVVRGLPTGNFVAGNSKVDGFLHVRYKTDTQMPVTQLRIRRPDREPVYVHINARNLYYTDSTMGITMCSGALAALKERVAGSIKNLPELQQAAKDNRVNETRLRFVKPTELDDNHDSKLRITGDISEEELKQLIAQKNLSVRKEGHLSHDLSDQDLLLALLRNGQAIDVAIYSMFMLPEKDTKTEYVQQSNFNKYFCAATFLANTFGYYWFSKMQGATDDWKNPDFPMHQIEPPRWMTTAFGPYKDLPKEWADEDEANQVPDKLAWTSFAAPDVWPSADELNFVLRLALTRDRQFHRVYLDKLFNPDKVEITARFHANPSSEKSFLAEVHVDVDFTRLQAALPGIDTHLKMETSEGIKLAGVIVENQFSTRADFCAHVTSNKPAKFGDQPYKVTIKFRDDATAYRRCMASMLALQRGHPERTTGVYLPGLLLGAEVPDGHNAISKVAQPAINSFRRDLDRWGLNWAQEEAAVQTFASEKNVAIIYGPPGTGKTKTATAAIEAHIKHGNRVLVCGPTNEAVNALVEQWQANADPATHLGRWAIFKGAYIKPGVQRRTTQESFLDPEDREDEAYSFWAQMAVEAAGGNVDEEFKKGFSYRRWQTVQAVARDGHHMYHEEANEYIRLVTMSGKRVKSDRARLEVLEESFGALFLNQAKVVFATCSMACHPMLTDHFAPSVAFIDEAGAATTPDLATPLVAFGHCIKRVVLSGDHHQQPPVVISMNANEGYETLRRPLLATLLDTEGIHRANDEKYAVRMLIYQYRMHRDISDWSNHQFYQAKLVAAPNTVAPNEIRSAIDDFFAPTREYFEGDRQRYRMAINVDGKSRPWKNSTSPSNVEEAEVLCRLISAMLDFQREFAWERTFHPEDMMIVTPYTGQKRLIREMLLRDDMHPAARYVRVWTTNTCQGHEAVIVFVSLTSADPDDCSTKGFIWRKEQLNVELTRAKIFCCILGSFEGWLQGMKDKAPGMTEGRLATFRSLLTDLHDSNDIITSADLAMALDPYENVLTRENGQFPKEFVKRPKPKSIASGDKRKANEAFSKTFIDPATGGALKPEKKPKASDFGLGRGRGRGGGRGGRGGQGRGRGRGQAAT
ncbi:hypothetical protein KC331_g1789 [Hortaea werneckii]|nr:hypothetical protein KC331_g1789 [Hortaea werneckii]KAI7721204.1 hypothetical protein KC353_g1544 [Hortaea werneckii]